MITVLRFLHTLHCQVWPHSSEPPNPKSRTLSSKRPYKDTISGNQVPSPKPSFCLGGLTEGLQPGSCISLEPCKRTVAFYKRRSCCVGCRVAGRLGCCRVWGSGVQEYWVWGLGVLGILGFGFVSGSGFLRPCGGLICHRSF